MTCEEQSHDLWSCHSPTPSVNGKVVYVICSCKKRRAVPAPEWAIEAARRAKEAARLARMPEQRVEDGQLDDARGIEGAAQG